MFPIINVFGEVIAFGGRVLDSSQPKYLNTRDTALFNKRKNLYGLNLVRKLKTVKSVVIVEGLYGRGIDAGAGRQGRCCVARYRTDAGAGGALKALHEHRFSSPTTETRRARPRRKKAISVLAPEGFDLRVIRFDADTDPDDFIRKHGLQGFAKKVREASTGDGLPAGHGEKSRLTLRPRTGGRATHWRRLPSCKASKALFSASVMWRAWRQRRVSARRRFWAR